VTYTTVNKHPIKQSIDVLNEKKQISTRNFREKPKIADKNDKKLNQTIQIVPLVSTSTNIGKEHRANSLEPIVINSNIVKKDKDLRNKQILGNFIFIAHSPGTQSINLVILRKIT
jgi:hypothetical protein